MVLVNNKFSVAKTDLYRAEVGQQPVSWGTWADSPANFCQNISNIQAAFLAKDQALLATAGLRWPGVGDNLFTFMANRLAMSFTNLACQNFGLTNPVTVTLDGNGAATDATFNTTPQQADQQRRDACARPAMGTPAPPADESVRDVRHPRDRRRS